MPLSLSLSSCSSYYGTGFRSSPRSGPLNFLLGTDWAPTAAEPLYGIFPLIVGTLLVTLGAMVFAVPLSIGCAIYISELASPRMKSILKPAIELLAGIPSVVYGFFGLIVLTNFIRVAFDLPTGRDLACGLGAARHHGAPHDRQRI